MLLTGFILFPLRTRVITVVVAFDQTGEKIPRNHQVIQIELFKRKLVLKERLISFYPPMGDIMGEMKNVKPALLRVVGLNLSSKFQDLKLRVKGYLS